MKLPQKPVDRRMNVNYPVWDVAIGARLLMVVMKGTPADHGEQAGRHSSMRNSKGHAGLACQACHESTHGLCPVTPEVDQTT